MSDAEHEPQGADGESTPSRTDQVTDSEPTPSRAEQVAALRPATRPTWRAAWTASSSPGAPTAPGAARRG